MSTRTRIIAAYAFAAAYVTLVWTAFFVLAIYIIRWMS